MSSEKQSINISQLRESLKLSWLTYYHKNRSWLIQMRIWGTYDGQRRPSSGFILGILSQLDPELIELFPLILDLNNNPDQIISALGLNFNPDEHLNLVKSNHQTQNSQAPKEIKALPSVASINKVANESNSQHSGVSHESTTVYSIPNEVESINNPQLPSSSKNPPALPNKSNTSTRKSSHLACWIDEFCQGASWDRDESIVIPF